MSDWFEDMEKDEQARDAMEYELALEYKRGRADKYQEITSKYMLLTEKQLDDIKAGIIDDVIKKLAKTEDTILTDKQYYTLIELKE